MCVCVCICIYANVYIHKHTPQNNQHLPVVQDILFKEQVAARYAIQIIPTTANRRCRSERPTEHIWQGSMGRGVKAVLLLGDTIHSHGVILHPFQDTD